MLLAILINTVSYSCDKLYRTVRDKFSSMEIFVYEMAFVTKYFYLKSFDDLFRLVYKVNFKKDYSDTS
jgi:hypothetical protein